MDREEILQKEIQNLLVYGCSIGNPFIMEFALRWGGKLGCTDDNLDFPIIVACKNNRKWVLEGLIEKGVDLETREIQTSYTPLIVAVINKNTEIVKRLLKEKVNVNARDKDGKTALMYACDYCNKRDFNIVKDLVDAGADIHLIDNNGYNATSYAGTGTISDYLKNLGGVTRYDEIRELWMERLTYEETLVEIKKYESWWDAKDKPELINKLKKLAEEKKTKD